MEHAKIDRSTRTNWEWEIPNCPRNIVVSEPVPCSLFFWGVGGGGATHWTTDMFIVSANIFRWSLSGQVWSDFSYFYGPAWAVVGPALGFALAVNCSPAITPQHYISTLHLNIIPFYLNYYNYYITPQLLPLATLPIQCSGQCSALEQVPVSGAS